MTIFRCPMCGGDLTPIPGTRYARCEYCGTKQLMTDSELPPTAPEPEGLHLLPEQRIDQRMPVCGADVTITCPLAEGEGVRYYRGRTPEGGAALIAAAQTTELNGLLRQSEQTLRHLQQEAARIEAEHTGSRPLGYDLLFPRLQCAEDSAVQGGRRVQLLLLPNDRFFPLQQLLADGLRLDLKTGAWILGRLLKLLGFAHLVGVSVPIERAGVLIDPDGHGLVLYDWTQAQRWPQDVPSDTVSRAIAAAADFCLALTGEPETCTPGERDYLQLLREMRAGQYTDAMEAHHAFYTLIRQIWGIRFHPFTTYRI